MAERAFTIQTLGLLRRATRTHHALGRVVAMSVLLQMAMIAIPVLAGQIVDHASPRTELVVAVVVLVGLATGARLVRGHILVAVRRTFVTRMAQVLVERGTEDAAAAAFDAGEGRAAFVAPIVDGAFALPASVLLGLLAPSHAVVGCALVVVHFVLFALARRGYSSAEALRAALEAFGPVLLLGAWWTGGGSASAGAAVTANALAFGFLAAATRAFEGLGEIDRVRGWLARAPERGGPAENGLAATPRLRGEILLENVSHRPTSGAPLAVEDVSVHIAPGRFVAIVGRSGAGKSTLAMLLAGLVNPTSGEIRYDGTRLAEIDRGSLRRQIGYVPQRPPLVPGTIRQNIALADPAAPEERIVLAAERAQIHDDILRLARGYDTELPAGGSSLSQGERQRIAVARAILRRPPILVLDDATSALDAGSERRLHDELARLRSTRIVVAQRLSTVRRADVILVIERGQIVEVGRHRELFARDGLYAALFRAQLAERPPLALLPVRGARVG